MRAKGRMDEKGIYLTDEDMNRLRILIAGCRDSAGMDRANLESLEQVLYQPEAAGPDRRGSGRGEGVPLGA